MADVNGGALSFTSIMDNDQMNAAIEETLRRVQGFSDAVVGSGDTMDNTTQEIVESIQIQKRVIEELEKTVADLNERINSVEPGTAQDALIEQANAARAELDGEKQGMVALINELNNLQRAMRVQHPQVRTSATDFPKSARRVKCTKTRLPP